jgi:hypothetical protein
MMPKPSKFSAVWPCERRKDQSLMTRSLSTPNCAVLAQMAALTVLQNLQNSSSHSKGTRLSLSLYAWIR